MHIPHFARFTTACLVAGAMACASGTARVDDEAAAAPQDTTTAEPPPGYSGMEQDTTMTPDTAATAVDTFLYEQGTGVPADTQGYGGFEQPDTTGAHDTSGYQAPDQTGYDTTGQTGYDTTGQTGYDTTGYNQPDPTGWEQDTSGMTGQTDTSGMTGMDTGGYDTGLDSVPQ